MRLYKFIPWKPEHELSAGKASGGEEIHCTMGTHAAWGSLAKINTEIPITSSMAGPITSSTLVYISNTELIVDYVLSFTIVPFVLYWWYRSYSKMGITFQKMLDYGIHNGPRMAKQILTYGFFHRKNLKNRYAGIMHFLISWGILILFIATALIFLSHDILKPTIHQGILVGDFYLNFEVWANLGGLMLIVGIIMAFARRLHKKVRLDTKNEDYVILSGLLIMALEGFFLGGLKIYLFRQPFDVYRFLEWPISYIFQGFSVGFTSGVELYRIMWMVHVVTGFLLAAYLPFSKLSHMALAMVMIGEKKIKKRGELPTPFILADALATGNFDFKVGVKDISELSSLQKIDALACTDCGRCERACPAVMAGTDLSPRAVVQNIKKNIYNGGEMTQLVLSENAAWSCTTCQACVEECPVLIEPFSFIMDVRKNLVMENRFSKQAGSYFNNLTNTQNPFGNSPSDRDALLDVAPKYCEESEYLYWVGCMGAFDPRDNKTARTILGLLNKAGVKYGILGSEEKCVGETARRMGEEGRFQELVMQNVETLNGHGVKKIITACPHCYNTFKNEYPRFGLKAEVMHHSEFLADLVKDGKLKVRNSQETVTLHDPCYLGRVNGKYDDTRLIVASSSNLKEMERSRENSFCCGAGGGNYWYKVESQDSISQIRMKQALETGARKLAVACPFCMPMMEDASRTLNVQDQIAVKDIAEIISENLVE
ncbi:MAG: heterodisulfide reductase-related iron-sulfur binding cluster [Candidatus Thermoplasmatota archaeon]|nr:heterodisulfide reductase-related iron-sulfur binding cluster [Candidatus Thermoplasmatota archaeon]